MPELPEVEVTRQTVQPHLLRARVVGCTLGKPLRWPLGCDPQSLLGRVVRDVRRRGKYLWVEFFDGGGLLIHLGMSGSLSFSQNPLPAAVHDHFELRTDRGTLRLNDPRRFGAVVWSETLGEGMAAKLLAGLGAEPFDEALTGVALHAAWRKRRVPIKLALLAGDVVVGVGNIYASEALFRSGIDPRLPAQRLSRSRCERLLAEIRAVLARAMALGGSSLRDFRDVHGMAGAFQLHAGVYGREGQPCPGCDRPIARIVQSQRSTFFCKHCQAR
jgi:formamidopyrimidine-DNA glycosylase